MREGSLEAPTRHPIDWQSEEFYDEAALDAELRRAFDYWLNLTGELSRDDIRALVAQWLAATAPAIRSPTPRSAERCAGRQVKAAIERSPSYPTVGAGMSPPLANSIGGSGICALALKTAPAALSR